MTEETVARTEAPRTPTGDQASWPPWKERVLRGMALWASELGGEIEHVGHGVYSVPGCNGGSYTVHLDVFGEGESCDCPDHRRHPELTCKHLVAATIYRARARMAARREAEERRARRGAASRELLTGMGVER